ncbi:MAG: hypothetical protein A4E53_04044 [Pelotomaculum sp. PtaB.Bin104]|nr:MAG: hypothetical protein A4E53_04044 [Pelotomaculum sp. PtaB.Bin104]
MILVVLEKIYLARLNNQNSIIIKATVQIESIENMEITTAGIIELILLSDKKN